jgi:hypothetical protein
MSFNNLLQYNQAFLNNVDSAGLERLVENCFTSKSKNYELLANLTVRLGTYQICPLNHAISLLEDKAVEVMIDNYRNETIQILKESSYAGLPSVWYQIQTPIPYGMSIKSKKEKILNMADKFLTLKENITQHDIENYALVTSLPKVFKLIIDKKVNLREMNVSFPQFEVEYQKPLLTSNSYNSIEDILLTHTYAENKNATEVRAIYTHLLNENSKMANEALKYTALNILKGDDIKIFFGPKFGDFEGGYMPFLNYVIVNPTSEKISDAAVAIHEIGHYLFCNLTPDAGCFPFDNSKIKLLSSTQDNQYGFFLNQTNANNSSEIKYFSELNKVNNVFLHYEIAAKPIFIKMGELLGLNKNALDPYVLSKDSILYLKDNTLIDLFLGTEKTTLSHMKAYAEAYYQYSKEFPGTSLNENLTFIEDKKTDAICFAKPSYQDIENLRFDDQQNLSNQIDFVKNYYLPYFINKMNLTDNQVWFLNRMSEMFNREKDIYEIGASYFGESQPKYSQYYIELIVRYPEFIASGMDQDILDSFTNLVEYYESAASPLVQEQINEFFAQYKAVDYSLFV